MRWLLYLSVFSAICCVSYCAQECNKPKQADTITPKINALQAIADSLQAVIDTMQPVRIEKVRTAVKWREKYIHDTLRIQHFDTACPELVGEVAALWQVVRYDSAMIDHMGSVIRLQDSVIDLHEVRYQQQAEKFEAVNKAQKKALRNARLLNYGLGAALIFAVLSSR